MQESVQALTDKIYQEGIEKAEEKGQQIIEDAKEKAQGLVSKAQEKADEIIANAEKRAADLKTKVDAELRLSSRQALGMLKQRITDLLILEVTSEPIDKAFENTEFISGLIEKLVDFWLANFGQEERIRLLLPEDDYKEYREYVEARSQELLKKGIAIEFKGAMKKGFQIETIDNRFKVSFTADDFENYFRTFARPRTYKLLFGEEN
jgi:V/A-type H+-transporting ATPase subunit E